MSLTDTPEKRKAWDKKYRLENKEKIRARKKHYREMKKIKESNALYLFNKKLEAELKKKKKKETPVDPPKPE